MDAWRQPYVLSWLDKKGRQDLAWDKRGAVVWLRGGVIAAETTDLDTQTQAELQLLTEKVFNRFP